MQILITEEIRQAYLVLMAGGAYGMLHKVYDNGGDKTKELVLEAMADGMADLNILMDMYGLEPGPEGIARVMMLTEDLIGCSPQGSLERVTPDEAVRKVGTCPWADGFADDGGTCRLIMAAVEKGLCEKYGLKIVCEKTLAEGADHCRWKVVKNIKGEPI